MAEIIAKIISVFVIIMIIPCFVTLGMLIVYFILKFISWIYLGRWDFILLTVVLSVLGAVPCIITYRMGCKEEQKKKEEEKHL